MSSPIYRVEGNLNPGFCPYVDGFVLEELYKKQKMISRLFKKQKEKLVTFAWQEDLDLPSEKLPKKGLAQRYVNPDKAEFE